MFTNLLAVFFYVGTRVLFDIRVSGLRNFSVSPSTVIATVHKSDLDEIIVASTIHLRRTLFRPRFRMWFAARDDTFAQGFLSTHFQLPRFLGRLLHAVDLSPIMAAFRARPISRLTRINVGQILRDVYGCEGNVPLRDVLKTQWIARFARFLPPSIGANLRNVRLRDFLKYDYRLLHTLRCESSMLRTDVLKKMRRRLLDRVNSQLAAFSNILDEGGILFFTPEDEHSPDGRFGPVRSGLHRLVRMAKTDIRILPISITYDRLATGRIRVHVAVGPEIMNLKELAKNEFERLVQTSLTRLGVVGVAQIGGRYLWRMAQENAEVIEKDLFVEETLSLARKLRSLGLTVDDDLTDRKPLAKRLDKFVKYCLARHWLRSGSNGRLIVNRNIIPDSSQSIGNAHALQYSYNELITHQLAYGVEEPALGL